MIDCAYSAELFRHASGQFANMRDSKPIELAFNEKAELIDGLYDVAIDPTRFQYLLDIWENRLAPLRGSLDDDLSDEDLSHHAARAVLFLERYERSGARSSLTSALNGFGMTAAFASADGRTMSTVNPAAEELFGIARNSSVSELPIEPEDAEALGTAIRSVVSGAQLGGVVRGRSTRTGGPMVFRIRPFQDGGRSIGLVVTSELTWPKDLTNTLRSAFDLTSAEVDVVRLVTTGLAAKEIARDRGRSLATVRTQMKSILAKTETRSQSELVRLTLGLMDLATSGHRSGHVPVSQPSGSLSVSAMTLADGRRFEYLEFGAKQGKPCVFLSSGYGFACWPASAVAAAEKRGLRVLSPLRAGFGHSSTMPIGDEREQSFAHDVAEWLGHKKIERASMIALGRDLRHAVRVARLADKRISAIVGCSSVLPINSGDQLLRMVNWYRYIHSNSRHLPRLVVFMLKANLSTTRNLGDHKLAQLLDTDAACDLALIEVPEIPDALLAGADYCHQNVETAAEAIAAGLIAFKDDWGADILNCSVPVHLLFGAEDVQSPVETNLELAPNYPNVEIEVIDGAGQLLFFQEWPRVLDVLDRLESRSR